MKKQQLHFRADNNIVDAIRAFRIQKEEETGIPIGISVAIRLLILEGLKNVQVK